MITLVSSRMDAPDELIAWEDNLCPLLRNRINIRLRSL